MNNHAPKRHGNMSRLTPSERHAMTNQPRNRQNDPHQSSAMNPNSTPSPVGAGVRAAGAVVLGAGNPSKTGARDEAGVAPPMPAWCSTLRQGSRVLPGKEISANPLVEENIVCPCKGTSVA